MEKVLIASPTYDRMDYCFRDFIESLKAIDYENFDILILDNSRTKEFFEKIKKILGIKVIYDNTEEEKNMMRLISSRNKILEYALENGYEYILMMDSDVIPPINILKMLLSHKKDICSGIYFSPFIISGKTQILPVAWKILEESTFEDLKKQGKIDEKFKSHLNLRRYLTKEEVESKELFEVFIPSAGCMLLSKNVFKDIRYELLPKTEMEMITPTDEIYFIKKARGKGFKIYCDTSVICKHLVGGKFKEGKNPILE
jgi:GT2 family glycosyltransferase